MKFTYLTLGLFAIQALAIPFQYHAAPIPDTTAQVIGDKSPAPGSCGEKLERLLVDLTNTTLSLLFGSTTTTVGYAFCGLVMPAQHWETCTDYAVLGGSVVGISHLAIWKFPEIIDSMGWYKAANHPWTSLGAWAENDSPDEKTEVRPREGGE